METCLILTTWAAMTVRSRCASPMRTFVKGNERKRRSAPIVTPKPRFTQDESYRFEESFNPLGFVSGEQQHVAGQYIAKSSKPFGCKKPTKTEIYRDGSLVAAIKPKDDKTIVVLFDKKSHREIALLFTFALYLPY